MEPKAASGYRRKRTMSRLDTFAGSGLSAWTSIPFESRWGPPALDQ